MKFDNKTESDKTKECSEGKIKSEGATTNNTLTCPVCHSEHLQKNGHDAQGVQKFICKYCGRTFSL